MEKNSTEMQAFCEDLGRWEPARIREELDDGNFLVSFVGWSSSYDAVVQPHRIRNAVHPFQCEVGK